MPLGYASEALGHARTVTGLTQCFTEGLSHGIEVGRIGISIGSAEVELFHSLHRHDVQMCVRDLEAGDHQTDSLTLDDRSLCLANVGRHLHQMLDRVELEIEPVIDFGAGNDQDVAGMQRSDVDHGDTNRIAPNETTGDLAFNDAGENRRHRRRW
jgi:hypothetical protein